MSALVAFVLMLAFTQSGTPPAPESMSRADTRVVVTKDLAGRLKVPASAIRVESEADRTWPDDTLGCGRKGVREPSPSPVPGFVFMLTYETKRFEYHTDTHGRVRRCDTKKAVGPIEV